MFVFLILIKGICAGCSENKININSASLEKLDELYGIGEVKAQAIIDSRPFETIYDLISVNGIGEKTLEKIINQELACVQEDNEDEKEEEKEIEFNNKDNLGLDEINENFKKTEKEIKEKPKVEVIKLTKDIKTNTSQEDKEKPNQNDYPLYLLIIFCILLGFLFAIKKLKIRKNEFD